MRVYRTLLAIVTLALLGSWVLPFAAVSAARASVGTILAAPATGVSTPPSTSIPHVEGIGVRRLPLLSSALEDRLAGKMTKDLLMAEATAIATSLGITWSELTGAAQADYASHDYSHPAYPYRSMQIDMVTSKIAPEKLSTPTAVVDLASIAMLQPSLEFNGAIAFSLLTRAQEINPSCDIVLDRAFEVSMGQTPDVEWVDRELRAAAAACPEDPTPLQRLASWHLLRKFMYEGGPRPESFDSIQASLAVAQEIQARFPGSPAGYAVAASAHLVLADNWAAHGVRLFTGRTHYTQAAALFKRAQECGTSPDLIIAYARAIAGLGRVADASALVGSLDLESLSPGAVANLRLVFDLAGDYQHALDAVHRLSARAKTGLLSRELLNKAPQITEPGVIGLPGMTDATGVDLQDKSFVGGGTGGSSVTDRGFLVRSRGVGRQGNSMPGEADYKILLDDTGDADTRSLDDMISRQNILRYGGKYDRALRVIDAYKGPDTRSALPNTLRAEVLMLAGRFSETKQPLVAAGTQDLDFEECGTDRLGVDWYFLLMGYSLENAGDINGAASNYELPAAGPAELCAYYANLQLGNMYLEAKKNADALKFLLLARDLAKNAGEETSGAAPSNAALAAIALGKVDLAVSLANEAVAQDPDSPIFGEILAEASRKVGTSNTSPAQPSASATSATPGTSPGSASTAPTTADPVERAVEQYEKAVSLDPSLFSSWNNLGVMYAKSDRHDDALRAFRLAIQARGDYEYAWFNYGTELLQRGAMPDVFVAQGALGIAGRADPMFRSLDPDLVFDEDPYSSGLDLSKELPAGWLLGAAARTSTTPLTVALLLVLALRAGVALLLDKVTGRVAEWLAALGLGGHEQPRWLIPGVLGIAGAAASLLYAAGPGSLSELALVLPLCIAVSALPSLVRRVIAPETHERTNVVGFVIAVILGATGTPWPPLPGSVDEGERPDLARRLVPAITIAVIAAYLVVTTATRVPIARTGLNWSLACLGALLLPVKPADGAYHPEKNWALTVGLAALTAVAGINAV